VPRILIVAPNWVGDTLLAQPLFARLQQRLPGVVIDALAPSWTAPLLARMPEITEVIGTPFVHGPLQLRERWRLGRSLRRRAYQQAIVLPNTFKAALLPFFADIGLRVGFTGEARYGLLNIVHKLDEKKTPLMAERYAQLAERPGEKVSLPLLPGALQVDAANLLISVGRLGLERSRPVVVFCPGAEYGPAKRWPARNFAALARRIKQRGRAVWLLGSAKERELGEEIVRFAQGDAINLCGRTDLATAIDLMSMAELVVSNDSGLMHVAAALHKPLVALYGSSSPEHTPPMTERAKFARIEGLACSPCYQRECPLGHFRCLNELAPEQVLGEIDALEAALK
jgi:heptosyltransferase-2